MYSTIIIYSKRTFCGPPSFIKAHRFLHSSTHFRLGLNRLTIVWLFVFLQRVKNMCFRCDFIICHIFSACTIYLILSQRLEIRVVFFFALSVMLVCFVGRKITVECCYVFLSGFKSNVRLFSFAEVTISCMHVWP